MQRLFHPDYLMGFLYLSPRASTPAEREIGVHLFVLAATWSIPLWLNDLWVLCRERSRVFNGWIARLDDGRMVLAAQALAVGTLAALTLVLRSRVSLDFIYFQF